MYIGKLAVTRARIPPRPRPLGVASPDPHTVALAPPRGEGGRSTRSRIGLPLGELLAFVVKYYQRNMVNLSKILNVALAVLGIVIAVRFMFAVRVRQIPPGTISTSRSVHTNTQNVRAFFLPKVRDIVGDVSGQTIIITGPTSGIGLATTRELVKKGAIGALRWGRAVAVSRAQQLFSRWAAGGGVAESARARRMGGFTRGPRVARSACRALSQ